jgi:predicted metal-dependent hydrolase
MRIDLEFIKSLFNLTYEELRVIFKDDWIQKETDEDGNFRFYVDLVTITNIIMFSDSFLHLFTVKQSCDP